MKSIHGFIYCLIVLLVSAGVFAAYLSINNIGAGPGNLPQLLQGTADRPAVYRVLIPTLAKSGSHLIPPETTAALQNVPENNMLTRAFHRISGDQYPEEAFCVLVLLYLSLTGFAYLEKSLLRDLGYSKQEQLALPLTLLIMILPFSVHFAYIYDIPQFFLSAACLLLMYRKKWIVYLAVFAIAVLNKETSLFITFVFATYHFGRLPGKRYLLLLVSQLAIFAVLRTAITYTYRNNPGSPILWSPVHHMEQYQNHPLTLIVTAALFGGILFLMFTNWKRKPVFLRHASSLFGIMLILFFLAGMPMEFRVFLDALPVFGIMIFPPSGTSQSWTGKYISVQHK